MTTTYSSDMTLEEYEELLGNAVRAALAANDTAALEVAKANSRDYLNKRFANEIAGIKALPRFKQFVPTSRGKRDVT